MTGRKRPRRGPRRFLHLILIGCVCAVVLVACDGGGGSSAPDAADAEAAGIGDTIRSGDWEITLLELPEKAKIVGEGQITYQADGIYLIVPVEVAHSGQEMQLLPGYDLRVVDDQGREFETPEAPIQYAYVRAKQIDVLIGSPLNPGVPRQSVIIFEITEDATGLTMTMAGTEDTIALGF